MTLVVGVDIGGSSVAAVAMDSQGQPQARSSVLAPIRSGKTAVAAASEAISRLGLADPQLVGVGIPGQVDPARGEVAMAVNLGIGSQPFALGPALETALGCPVTIENDVRAAAMGAYDSLAWSGSPPASLVILSIGTGIAAGAVVEGSLVRGAQGMAGEIGHLVIEENGPLCRCGQRGCLEAVAAGPAIARAWPGGDAHAANSLFSALAEGDQAAIKVANRITSHLTTALTWLAAAYDPERIIIGGGVAAAGEPLLVSLRAEIGRRAAISELAARRLRPEQVDLARTDDPPGPRGAAVLAAQRFHAWREVPVQRHASNPT
ncbi:MAG TPA: ROK family protein [Acidimicrobiia bacterium]|nr:ROK family protein [Acidimicrobiia bacterium]